MGDIGRKVSDSHLEAFTGEVDFIPISRYADR